MTTTIKYPITIDTTSNINFAPNADITSQLNFNKLKTTVTWDDVVAHLQTRAATAPPYNEIGALELYAYDFTINNRSVYFTIQLPHTWDIGSEIRAHFHAIPVITGATGSITFDWNYIALGVGSSIPGSTITLSSTIPLTAAMNNIANIYSFGSIPAGLSTGLSTLLTCRITRTAGTNITHFYVLSTDFHIQKTYLGSSTATSI